MTRAKIHHTIAFFLRRWHRRCGLAASLFVLWLVASGWALNHSEALGLPRIPVYAPWLLHWYGLKDTVPERGYFADGYWLVANSETVLLDGRPLPIKLVHPVGMAGTRDLLFIADRTSIAILTVDKRLVEELRGESLPVKSIERVGVADNRVVIEGESAIGETSRQSIARFATRDGLAWTPYTGEAEWSEARIIPQEVRATAARLMRASLPMERVLLDLHSGRVLGRYGPWFIDLIGLLLALLAISGVWMYTRRHAHRN